MTSLNLASDSSRCSSATLSGWYLRAAYFEFVRKRCTIRVTAITYLAVSLLHLIGGGALIDREEDCGLTKALDLGICLGGGEHDEKCVSVSGTLKHTIEVDFLLRSEAGSVHDSRTVITRIEMKMAILGRGRICRARR